MTVAIEIRRLSVQYYHRMVEAGILAPDERVELIEGQLQIIGEAAIYTAFILPLLQDYLKTRVTQYK
ncbi:MAG TPA: hypothetical protein V6D30_21025 [Leptolyngbyaceae cyanobacterium]|jgi:hypothetical protein